jgi:hypothetical protein
MIQNVFKIQSWVHICSFWNPLKKSLVVLSSSEIPHEDESEPEGEFFIVSYD